MIRRDATAADGSPLWLLIDQVAHARLAGQIAERWRWPHTRARGREQFLAAIFHHDDGWAAWDATPAVDLHHHRPLAFTEMPVAVSTALWTASIAAAETIGPLATYMVAGHFHALAERHDSWRRGPDDARQAAESFIDMAIERMAISQARWDAEKARSTPEDDVVLDPGESLRWLQLFDALSLWLCCAAQTEPEPFLLPQGVSEPRDGPASVTFAPVDQTRIAVDPWPFSISELRLETTARVMPACAIATIRLDMAAIASAQPIVWRLEPR